MGIINKKERDPFLLLELSHKFHLMLMNILKREGVNRTFLGVKADGNPLHRADVVHRALLVEIGERDMMAVLVDIDRGNGRGHLLDQRQPVSRYFHLYG